MLTVDSLKAYLKLSGTGRDAGLQLIVDTINAKIPTLTRRDWQRAARTEKRRGTGTPDLVLRHIPVTEVASLTVNGTAVDVEDEDVVTLDGERGILTMENGGVFPEGARVLVAYTGGPDGWPDDLMGAALEMAAYCYKASGGLSSSKGLSGSDTFVEGAIENLPLVCGTLQYHTDSAAGYLT